MVAIIPSHNPYLVPALVKRGRLERVRKAMQLGICRVSSPYRLQRRVEPDADLPPIESPSKFDALLGRSVDAFHYNIALRQILQKLDVIAWDMPE